MTELIYEAAVYSQTIKYKNYQGETKTVDLFFALDPLQLMRVVANIEFKPSKSANPAKKTDMGMSEDAQLKFLQDLAIKSAGTPSDDGESWIPYENFQNDLAGKAFITKLASSDGDRIEFAEKVVLDPFRSFVDFASADPSNSREEVQQFAVLLKQMTEIFSAPTKTEETLDEKRARLAREMEALGESNG